MISLQDFHQDFMQTIIADSQSRGLMKAQAFFENVCEELIQSGDLTNNYTFAEYTKTGMEVHGYDYDEERKILSLLIHEFFQDSIIQTLTMNKIDTKFNRLKTFFSKSIQGYRGMDETTDAYSMAYNIQKYYENNLINKVRFILITDGKSTRSLKALAPIEFENFNAELRVIDIEYIYKTYMMENSSGEFEINLNLPCLQVDTAKEQYESYLTVIPGSEIARIYDQFGQKLLEQNVRTFLQFKGKINKGLLNTIEERPEMFFAFNNGITATASEVILDEIGNICNIKNFQIVNGGQTVSSIYAASKGPGSKKPIDVSNVYVQMKLSVVKDKEKQNTFVSKVSEYANTQNKVNASDFFSNSPFHKEMKDYSKRLRIPASGASQIRAHWYYERVRGEYLNEQAYLSDAQKRQFQLENPKDKMIEKTFLSKSENAWLQKPDIVSKGAQYSFDAFAKEITDKLDADNTAITESFFKDTISRIILFKRTEILISRASWYDGGYRAQTVAYTISLLSYLVEKTNKYFNFNTIWEEQKVPEELDKIINRISTAVYDVITNPPEGSANIGQWAKKSQCWATVKSIDIGIDFPDFLMIDNEEKKYTQREAKKTKKIDSDIEIQSFVVKSKPDLWKKLYGYFSNNDLAISPMQLDILKKASDNLLGLPSAKQAKILYQLIEQAEEEGFLMAGEY